MSRGYRCSEGRKKELFFCHRNILAEEFGVKVKEEADSVDNEELLEMDS